MRSGYTNKSLIPFQFSHLVPGLRPEACPFPHSTSASQGPHTAPFSLPGRKPKARSLPSQGFRRGRQTSFPITKRNCGATLPTWSFPRTQTDPRARKVEGKGTLPTGTGMPQEAGLRGCCCPGYRLGVQQDGNQSFALPSLPTSRPHFCIGTSLSAISGGMKGIKSLENLRIGYSKFTGHEQ